MAASAEDVQLMPTAAPGDGRPAPLMRQPKMWGENWEGLSDRSLQLMKNSASTAEMLKGALNEKQAMAVSMAAKKTLLMNVHVTSKAEQEAREELDHAIAAVKTLYTNSLLEERAETGADVTPLARFRIAGKAVSQLAGILTSHEGLHALRKTLEDEWYQRALKQRLAKRELIEHEATFCHSAESPHLADETVEIKVLDPHSEFRHLWDGTQVVFLVYISLFVPYRVCFKDSPVPWRWDFILDMFIDCFFVVDVVLSFVTGYEKHNDGETEYDRKKVMRHYLTGWFTLDLLSILPLNYIMIATGTDGSDTRGTNSGAVRILRFAKLLKLLRLVRMKRILDRYEAMLGLLYSTRSVVYSILKLTIAIFFVGHILSCFWFLAGEDELAPDGRVISQGWISAQGMTLGAVTDDEGSTITTITRFDQYLHSMYWAMTTMTTVGYGDISASTTTEKIYIMFGMLIGGFMFGIIIGSLSKILATNNPLEIAKQERLAQIAGWLQFRDVPQELKRDVYEYYRNMFSETETGISEREILDVLPHTLAEPLIQHMFGKKDGGVMKMECWKKLSLDTLPYWSQVEVCMNLRPVKIPAHHSYANQKLQPDKPLVEKTILGARRFFSQDQRREEGIIFEEDVDDDRSIYIITEGHVDIKKKQRAYQDDGTWTCVLDDNGHVVYNENPHVRLNPGDCFGESCLLYLDDDAEYKRNYSAIAATDVKLFMLNRVAINHLRETQPEAFEKLKPFEQRRLEKMHKKAVDTLRAQGVAISDGTEPMQKSRSLDNHVLEGIQAVMSSSLEKMTVDLKKSMKTIHDESERLGNLEAKVDALSATLQQLVEK